LATAAAGYPCGGGFRRCDGKGGGRGMLGIEFSLLVEREKRGVQISLLASIIRYIYIYIYIYGMELGVNPKVKVFSKNSSGHRFRHKGSHLK
jgi:hypothetical protein